MYNITVSNIITYKLILIKLANKSLTRCSWVFYEIKKVWQHECKSRLQWNFFPEFKPCITLDCLMQFNLSSSLLIEMYNCIYLMYLGSDLYISVFLGDPLKEISCLYLFNKTILPKCSIFYVYSFLCIVLFRKVFYLFYLLFILIFLFTFVCCFECQANFHIWLVFPIFYTLWQTLNLVQ